MGRLGWTMEQRAGVKQLFHITSLFAVLGIIVGVILICMHNAGGWLLLAISVFDWTGIYITINSISKAQP